MEMSSVYSAGLIVPLKFRAGSRLFSGPRGLAFNQEKVLQGQSIFKAFVFPHFSVYTLYLNYVQIGADNNLLSPNPDKSPPVTRRHIVCCCTAASTAVVKECCFEAMLFVTVTKQLMLTLQWFKV